MKTSISVFYFANEYFVQHWPVNNICTIIHTFYLVIVNVRHPFSNTLHNLNNGTSDLLFIDKHAARYSRFERLYCRF